VDKLYLDYTIEKLRVLISIPSPSGFAAEAGAYVADALAAMGYAPETTQKGGVLVCLGGSGPGVVLSGHLDTLGAVVAEVKDNGRLRVSPIGGLAINNVESENVCVLSGNGATYGGTYQLDNPSTHVNLEYRETKRTYDNMEVVLDEMVKTRDETRALGIENGDRVTFDPRFKITPSGYIKSRHLDDKLCCAILLAFAKKLTDEHLTPKRKVYAHFTTYEEVGHGGAANVPADAAEFIALDMGCVGKGLSCDETMAAICAKDVGGPYSRETVSALIAAAKNGGVRYAVDVYASYGSDAGVAVRAGSDLRHACVGPGIYASHGYERCHVDGIKNTFGLLSAYLL